MAATYMSAWESLPITFTELFIRTNGTEPGIFNNAGVFWLE